jgi:UDP-N-acetylglucosamine 2-epimerase (non-hydrolysing)
MATVLLVVGARPNFAKVAPLHRALLGHPGLDPRLLHTGQHYDRALSDAFLEQLGLPEPDHHLGVGSGSHAEQTAGVLVGVERVLQAERPAALVVPGDVNSTLGAALAAAKLQVPVVHLESGLRSGDRAMAEEVNRVLVDHLAQLLLCHSQEAVDNLAAEGIAGERVALVGNAMIDTLLRLLPEARRADAPRRLGLERGGYVLVTLHRPELVDHPDRLGPALDVLGEVAERMPVVLPLHPRTRARLEEAHPEAAVRLRTTEALDYLHFVGLMASAALVVTDSGGVQEETSALGVPCLTYRPTTDRPVTIRLGTNRLVGVDPQALRRAAHEALDAPIGDPAAIPLWDGHAGERSVEEIARMLGAMLRAPCGSSS